MGNSDIDDLKNEILDLISNFNNEQLEQILDFMYQMVNGDD